MTSKLTATRSSRRALAAAAVVAASLATLAQPGATHAGTVAVHTA